MSESAWKPKKMSGWDEGNVFYSNGPEEEQAQEEMTRFAAQVKLKEFIRGFRDHKYNERFIYRESLLQDPKMLEVQLDDLCSQQEALWRSLRSNPAEVLPLFETAAAEVAASLKSKVPGETGEMEEPVHANVQILLTSDEEPMNMRALSAEYISKLVKVKGIVIGASKTQAKPTSITLMCKNCQNIKHLSCRPGFGGAVMPRSCDAPTQAGQEQCPLDPWIVVPERSTYVDQQTLKLQENPEDVPTGEMPRNLLMAVDRNLVQKITPGTRVTVFGIYSIFQASDKNKTKGAIAIRQPYLRVVGMEHAAEGSSRGAPTFTSEEEMEFKEFARQGRVYHHICARVAPSIFGHDDVKKAIACLLFGGSRKRLPDGVRLRGDINILLIGDPSTAKSQFLKFVEKTAPIAVYTSGKGSSAAGLTASVIRDPSSREFYLEGGAMVLADGGVVCIDEFDKMRPEDRVAIHEAMEQQTISIAKAGITTVLNSRAAVLAAANPPSGRYDDLKTAQENIDLQTTILSRFDLIFIVRDARDHARDMEIARHVVNVHATADAVTDSAEQAENLNWLKRYVEFAKSRCSPRLDDRAAHSLREKYVDIRQGMLKRKRDTGEGSPIPITVRQLEAIVRIAESIARMQLSPVATQEHVDEALRLFQVSTLDAAQSGVMDHLGVTEEDRAEIQHIEAQVKRRVGIGSSISERFLVSELARTGMAESSIRRALLVMSQRGEIEYRKERRSIYRKQ